MYKAGIRRANQILKDTTIVERRMHCLYYQARSIPTGIAYTERSYYESEIVFKFCYQRSRQSR